MLLHPRVPVAGRLDPRAIPTGETPPLRIARGVRTALGDPHPRPAVRGREGFRIASGETPDVRVPTPRPGPLDVEDPRTLPAQRVRRPIESRLRVGPFDSRSTGPDGVGGGRLCGFCPVPG